MDERIRILERAVDEDQRAAVARAAAQEAKLKHGLTQIDAKIAEVGKAMDALGLSARKSDANFGATLDGMLSELQKLRGEVEELKHAGEELRLGLAASTAGLETVKLETQAQIESIASAASEAKLKQEREAERLLQNADRGQLLELADSKLKAGDFQGARIITKDFLKRWPEDKQAGGAQLILAESYFRAKDYRPAILEYATLRKKFPTHPYLPGALLNIGECFIALGHKKQASAAFHELLQTFKDSEAAASARRRMKALKIK